MDHTTMDHTASTTTSDRPFRIPTIVWLIAAGLVAALVAVFVFNVALSTVISYGLIGLMILSHLFMHGGHGSHGSHAGHAGTQSNADASADQKDTHAGHSGGCH